MAKFEAFRRFCVCCRKRIPEELLRKKAITCGKECQRKDRLAYFRHRRQIRAQQAYGVKLGLQGLIASTEKQKAKQRPAHSVRRKAKERG